MKDLDSVCACLDMSANLCSSAFVSVCVCVFVSTFVYICLCLHPFRCLVLSARVSLDLLSFSLSRRLCLCLSLTFSLYVIPSVYLQLYQNLYLRMHLPPSHSHTLCSCRSPPHLSLCLSVSLCLSLYISLSQLIRLPVGLSIFE